VASIPQPISVSGAGVDLSTRFATSVTVAASPALAAITTIATITISSSIVVVTGIQLWGWCAFTVGTSGVTAKLDIRQTNTTGAVVATTGLTTVTATNLVETGTQGLDTAGVLPGQVYVLCLTIGSGAAASTVSAVQLTALVI
jgi:hypothetical protein